jgi:hypothetical protein
MYASTLESVRSGICNLDPWRIGDCRRDDRDCVEPGAPPSSDSGFENRILHSYSR